MIKDKLFIPDKDRQARTEPSRRPGQRLFGAPTRPLLELVTNLSGV
jgi:hypothetical protein